MNSRLTTSWFLIHVGVQLQEEMMLLVELGFESVSITKFEIQKPVSDYHTQSISQEAAWMVLRKHSDSICSADSAAFCKSFQSTQSDLSLNPLQILQVKRFNVRFAQSMARAALKLVQLNSVGYPDGRLPYSSHRYRTGSRTSASVAVRHITINRAHRHKLPSELKASELWNSIRLSMLFAARRTGGDEGDCRKSG